MRKSCLGLAAAVAVLLFMGAPAAHATGFYVGGSLGSTSSDLQALDASGATVDDSDTGYKVFGGYNFFKFFQVEAAWVDVAGAGAEMTNPTPMSISTSADGFAVEAMGVMPLGLKFQAFAEVGLFLWDGEVSASSQGVSGQIGSGDGTDPTYGLGFAWNVIPKAQIRVEAERYSVDVFDETMDLDMYSAGFAYRF